MNSTDQKRPESSAGTRGAVIAVVIGVLALTGFLLMRQPSGDDATVAATDDAADAPTGEIDPATVTPITSSGPVPLRPGDAGIPIGTLRTITREDLQGLTVAEQAALLGDTDLTDGFDLPPPALPTGPPTQLPEAPVARPEYVIGQREAGLQLIDTTIERLSTEADELEQQGNADAARRVRARIERTRAVRARRETELETLRQGGALPSSDLEGSDGRE
jgi:hypothetical protein